MSTNDMVSRIYAGFRGVDFRGEECHLSRSPDALNVWRDYKNLEGICTRPSLASRLATAGTVWGIYFYRGGLYVHAGTSLYFEGEGGLQVIFSGLAARKSAAFIYGGVFYLLDGDRYLSYNGVTASEVVGYVPTTSIGCIPLGGGEKLEDINFLSPYRINTFLADGVSVEYHLDAQGIDDDYKPEVCIGGVLQAASSYTVDYNAGVISFVDPPEKPLTDGQDNVSVKFKKTVAGYRERIGKCRLCQVFDNRVFFSGNPELPNYVWHSSLDDPTYVSDQDEYREGMDDAAVRGLVAGNNALWVFREPSDMGSTAFYHQPMTDDEYGKIYPSSHSSISTGCLGAAINFGDDIVFFSDRGMEGRSGDITTEQFLSHRSSLIDRKLLSCAEYRNMILAEWEGYLLVFIGQRVFLADSRAMFQNEDHYEYEWFYWETEQAVRSAAVYEGVLYLGTDMGIYTVSDKEGAVAAHWVTAKDKFNYPHMQKTTNKRGCVCEALGDLSVSVRVENGEFEPAEVHEDISDAFVCRIKKKKFKDIQFKFHSTTRFSLESFTMECFVGGYIKR